SFFDEAPVAAVAAIPDVGTATAPSVPDAAALPDEAATGAVPPAVETGGDTTAVPAHAAIEAAAEAAPPDLFSLSGEVIDVNGNAVRGALVNLTPSDYRQAWSSGVSMMVRQAVSDGSGRFYIDDIRAGSYRLAASMDGYGD